MPDVPKNAKKPQDHKQKAETPTPGSITVRGVEFTVAPDALDDFELLDDINELEQNGNPARLPSILRRLLGDQYGQAMDLARDTDTGRVTVEAGAALVSDVLGALNPN